MSGTSRALGLGEYLVRRACRYLPSEIRDERCREWTAELPHILHHPEVRFAATGILRMLAFAFDHSRGVLANRTLDALVNLRRLVAIVVVIAFTVVVGAVRVVRDTALVVVLPGAAAGFAFSIGAPDVIVVVVGVAGLAVEAALFFVLVSLGIRREERTLSLRIDSPSRSVRVSRQLMGVTASRWD